MKVLKFYERRRVTQKPGGSSLTRQSFAKECDVNSIMAKYRASGLVSHVNRYQGRYVDLTNVPCEYQEALALVMDAQDMFMSLPARIRATFANDPGRFLDFVSDPRNAGAMREMGLLPARPADKEPAEPAMSEPRSRSGTDGGEQPGRPSEGELPTKGGK